MKKKESATVQEEILNIISNILYSELGIILTCDDALFVKLHQLQTLVANISGQELDIQQVRSGPPSRLAVVAQRIIPALPRTENTSSIT